ncbi:caspase family protein [Azospirillum sp. Sh1]|uniref:caspase family protein n=1 Tax=Azospirillum sp. Sh1 TaxID=2607285 RepID=UPI001FFE8154|nr:caspase family protein [Azospirillum sp. Sh1]
MVATAAGLALGPAPARAEIGALVIGIDRYTQVNPLQGAVNDARDIADALKGLGVRKLRLFIDGEAERSRIIAAWRQLIAETAPDSTLVLTFAGHGAQQPERVPGSEADGMDEFLVLADFAPRGPGTAQRLTDDEIAVLLKEAAPRRVIFISDSCHSGTMTRAFDDRAGMLGTRAAKIDGVPVDHIEDDALPLPTRAALQAEAEEQPNVTFFAAVADHELAPEVMIDRKPRGALSWAFANALRGQADRDGDGIVTKGELEAHVRGAVRMALEGRQHPQVQPRGRGEIPLIDPVAGRPKPPSLLPAAGPIPLRILGKPAAVKKLAAGFTGIELAGKDDPALVWDGATGEVVSSMGDVLASIPGDPMAPETRRRVQGVVDKWALVVRVKAAAQDRSLTLAVEPGDRDYRKGETVSLAIGGNSGTYFTLINLAADGTVNYLYPLAERNDPAQIPRGGPYRLALTVEPPFGADHFLAIASPKPMTGLQRDLAALDGKPAAGEVAALLTRHLTGQPVEFGIHGVYSTAR